MWCIPSKSSKWEKAPSKNQQKNNGKQSEISQSVGKAHRITINKIQIKIKNTDEKKMKNDNNKRLAKRYKNKGQVKDDNDQQ